MCNIIYNTPRCGLIFENIDNDGKFSLKSKNTKDYLRNKFYMSIYVV